MEQSARRQILADLGIVPWQLRVLAGATGSLRSVAADAAAAASEPAARRGQPQPPVEPEAQAARHQRQSASAERAAAPPAAAHPSAEPREEPWSALSLVSGGALLLVSGDASRRDLRLAMDVLGAAAGDFRARPATRRFDWPPPGAEGTLADGGSGHAGARALLAFVDKDLTDHGVRRVLCTAGIDARLPPLAEDIDRVAVPELATLGQDPDAKRALWQALERGSA